MEKQPGNKYGISWGVSPNELKKSLSTRPLLREYLGNLEKKQYTDAKMAFNKIKTYFNV